MNTKKVTKIGDVDIPEEKDGNNICKYENFKIGDFVEYPPTLLGHRLRIVAIFEKSYSVVLDPFVKINADFANNFTVEKDYVIKWDKSETDFKIGDFVEYLGGMENETKSFPKAACPLNRRSKVVRIEKDKITFELLDSTGRSELFQFYCEPKFLKKITNENTNNLWEEGKVLAEHLFVLAEGAGGEELNFVSTFVADKDTFDGIRIIQKFIFQTVLGNSVVINLTGGMEIDSKILRRMADELEQREKKAIWMAK